MTGLSDNAPDRGRENKGSAQKRSPPFGVPAGPRGPLIHREDKWRAPAGPADNGCALPRILASRWKGADLREQTSEIVGDYHMMSVCIQRSQFSLWLGAKHFPNKQVLPGMIQFTGPALPARIVYHEPYDTLHLRVENSLLREYYEWAHGRRSKSDVILRDPSFSQDPWMERLGLALLSADEISGSYGQLYADSLSLTILSYALALYGESPAPTGRRAEALPKWRLKRAVEFIEAHANKRISLADIADAVGLSRMHFAAQFRKATGYRPHEFVLRRRIERAKIMLTTSTLPIVDVALTLGFSSQAQFTSTFKRFTGSTPHQWRRDSQF
jgi:AraC family transcriptional regulator